jgi:ComF family protein
LIRFKFYGALHTVPALAQIAVEVFRKHFQSHEFDMIVPVPIHRSRLVHRGFNQAIILGERLSAGTGIPLYRTALRKVKDTVPQVGLPRAERLLNVRGSFAVSRREVVKDRRILLIDDVATTGSTINEAAKVLMKGKAQRVDALVLALRLSSDVHAEEAPEHPLTSGP